MVIHNLTFAKEKKNKFVCVIKKNNNNNLKVYINKKTLLKIYKIFDFKWLNDLVNS